MGVVAMKIGGDIQFARTFLGSFRYVCYFSDVGGHFGKEWNLDGCPNPATDVPDQVWLLSTRQTHPSLPHPVGAGEVELQGIGTRFLGKLAEFNPVLLYVATHDAGYHYLLVVW